MVSSYFSAVGLIVFGKYAESRLCLQNYSNYIGIEVKQNDQVLWCIVTNAEAWEIKKKLSKIKQQLVEEGDEEVDTESLKTIISELKSALIKKSGLQIVSK